MPPPACRSRYCGDEKAEALAVVHLANGAKYRLPEVRLEPAGTAVVDLNAALAQVGIASWADLFGYVEVQYS
ncbi:MAG: hypothetical protein JO340_19480, partial [Acidobacteriaceae bacterium]|nr:hypothetical protein [Acidobacteriaceae bacterium]